MKTGGGDHPGAFVPFRQFRDGTHSVFGGVPGMVFDLPLSRPGFFLFAQPIPWARVLGSLSILIGFNLTAFLIGTAAFQARDIKS